MAPLFIGGLSMGQITGPLYLAGMLGNTLYGALAIQLYVYSHQFPRDPVGIKLVVYGLFFLETLFIIFLMNGQWIYFGNGWGDLEGPGLSRYTWCEITLTFLNGLTGFIAQTFYVWRLWKISRSPWFPLLTEAAALLSWITILVTGVNITHNPTFEYVAQDPSQHSLNILWLSTTAICDVMITGGMVFVLNRNRSDNPFSRTTGIVSKLIFYTVEIGLVTSVVAFLELAIWLALPGTNWFYICFITIGRLYANALMAMLNSRILLRSSNRGHSQNTTTDSSITARVPSSIQFATPTGRREKASTRTAWPQKNGIIHVDTPTYTEHELESYRHNLSIADSGEAND